MAGIDELRERVATMYAGLGAPSWPNPHPDLAAPADEEYSRVTDPSRYRVVVLRARAWATALAEVAGASVAELGPGSWRHQRHEWRHDRGLRVSVDRPDTLPLLLLERSVADGDDTDDGKDGGDDGVLPILHISAGEPESMLAMLPDCGCDACDQGSDDLLEAIDEAVVQVVSGPLVLLQADGWSAHWHPDGGGMSSNSAGPDHRDVMTWCRRLGWGERVDLPPGTRAYVGRSWLE